MALVISIFVTIAIISLSWLGWTVAQGDAYKAGDALGYNLGLAGGLLMLVLLTYPMRKYFGFMRRWGEMKYWFAFHMACGIVGPILIIFHSAFHLRSLNATVAFVCMLMVAGSGFIGRYAYRRIHRGFFGSKMTLEELKKELFGRENEAESKLVKYPKVLLILHQFHQYALEKEFGFWGKILKFFLLPVLRQIANIRCKMLLPSGSSRSRARRELVLDYLYGVERYAQFAVFERIFALWHVVHMPLVYLMVISAIWHVVAVHMY